jgi:hypothetical protein
MSTMITELYDARRDAGAFEEKAKAAAKAKADYDSRFNKVDAELLVINGWWEPVWHCRAQWLDCWSMS